VDERVAELTLTSALSREEHDAEELVFLDEQGIVEDYRVCEFWVTLKDERCFGFAVCTPEFARDYMEREHLSELVWAGLILVSEVTLDTILATLEECISHDLV